MERKTVLITVKTYPHPDPSDLERVCTAGILEDGEMIRLYPVPFRYLPKWQSYKKYQWINVAVERHQGRDRRKESYRPDVDTIQIVGPPLSTKDGWKARRDVVLRHPVRTMEQLNDIQDVENISLGIVRPRSIADLIIVPDEGEWKPEWRADLAQLRLDVGPKRLPLEKIPFKFRYKFTCDDYRCKGHTMSLGDWEAGVLFLRERQRLGNDEAAAKSVRSKFLEELCAADRDVHFFVGTVAQFGTWIVLGVFNPPSVAPDTPPLFQGLD
jgi:hypothetical protein